MIGELFNNPLAFLFWMIGLVLAITVHEFAHAWTADRLGDPTPRLQGRLTLNPLAHLDPLGTLLMLIARFGWGKPVVFDPFNLRNPRRDAALISLAGPASNLAIAIASSLLLRVLAANHIEMLWSIIIAAFLQIMIQTNIVLAVFNLVPIHPLDGFKIVGGLLPDEYARQWQELEGYGIIFLIFLALPLFSATPPINRIIGPIISGLLGLLLPGAL